MLPTELPKSANEWTLAIVESLVEAGYFENDTLDFKEFLVNDRDPNHKERLCKSASAFANTNGGFIIFGVTDKGSGKTRIVGIDPKDIPRFGDQVKKVEPSIYYVPQNPPIIISSSGNAVFVAHIPHSPRAPHAFAGREGYCFYKRTNQGSNEPMSYTEIENSFIAKNVFAGKLTLLYNQIATIRRSAELLYAEAAETEKKLFFFSHISKFSLPVTRIDCGILDVLVSDLYPIIKNDKTLLNGISTLKFVCEPINILIARLQVTQFTVGTKDAVKHYNEAMRSRVPTLIELTDAILAHLRDNYEIVASVFPLAKEGG